MNKKEKRQKASDVFKESNFLLVDKKLFQDAFPDIKSVKVSVEEKGNGATNPFSSYVEPSVYTERTLGEYINCSNPICYNGGVSIGSILRDMTRDKKTNYTHDCFCQGYEGSPKGYKRYRSCANRFKISVIITYN